MFKVLVLEGIFLQIRHEQSNKKFKSAGKGHFYLSILSVCIFKQVFRKGAVSLIVLTKVDAQLCSLGWNKLSMGKKRRLFQSQLSDEPLGLPTLNDLGVTPGTVQEKMPYELEAFRAFKYHVYWHFAQRPPIHPLVPISRLEEKQLLEEESFTKNLLSSLGLHLKFWSVFVEITFYSEETVATFIWPDSCK